MNDVRFDLSVGKAGFAYITDSSSQGPNGIVVVDLGTGESWRRLNNHPSTTPEATFISTAEGRPIYQTEPGKPAKRVLFGSDGIAISADGSRLYYCPLTGHTLYSVSTTALRDRSMSDDQVAATVLTVAAKGPSDGLESDTAGNVYAGDYESNSIEKIAPDGKITTIVHDPRLLWPDTMSLADDGYLYVTANQLHRQPTMHDGQDLRRKPYVLFRIKTDSHRISLKR
jgi:sugar lactone lactonase YvrE